MHHFQPSVNLLREGECFELRVHHNCDTLDKAESVGFLAEPEHVLSDASVAQSPNDNQRRQSSLEHIHILEQ